MDVERKPHWQAVCGSASSTPTTPGTVSVSASPTVLRAFSTATFTLHDLNAAETQAKYPYLGWMSFSDVGSTASTRPDRPLIVKATFDRYNKRITFSSARNCSYDLLRSKVSIFASFYGCERDSCALSTSRGNFKGLGGGGAATGTG